MKTIIKLIPVIFWGILFFSCEKQYGPYEYAPSVNFFTTNITLNENSNDAVEIMVFIHTPEFKSQKAPDSKTIVIKGYPVESTLAEAAKYGVDFTTVPEPEIQDTLLIWTFSDEAFQQDTARIVLTPVHDEYSIENKQFGFRIDGISPQLVMGSQSALSLTVRNVDAAILGYSLTAAPLLVNCPNTEVGTVSATSALFSLTSTGLTRDIIVAQTPEFKFSLTDNSADALDLLVIPVDKLDASGKVDVYVFFAPSARGTRSGALYISSYGVGDARVALRGTGV